MSRRLADSPAIHRAVIPAAGRGARLYPATRAIPKAMMTLFDRPAIQHVVEEAVAAGLDDLVIVISPGSAVADHFRLDDAAPGAGPDGGGGAHSAARRGAGPDADPEASADAGPGLDELERIASRARLRFVTQPHPAGLGHAVALAGEHLADEPFAVLLADVIGNRGELREMIRLAECEQASVVALEEIPAHEASAHGCAVIQPYRDRIVRLAGIAEKPVVTPPSPALLVAGIAEKPVATPTPSALKVAGRYVLRPEILPILADLPAGHGGEIQLSDAITAMAADQSVLGFVSRHRCLDIGSPSGYLAASLTLAMRHPGMRELIQATLGGG